MDSKIKREIDLAFHSTARLIGATKKEMPKKFLKRESSFLLKRAFSLWWRIRWPWLQRRSKGSDE